MRDLYAAFDARDVPKLQALLAADADWIIPGASPVSGRYHGHAAIFGLFAALGQRSGGTFRAKLRDVYAGEAGAVALADVSGQREGRSYQSTYLLRFAIRDGTIREARLYNEDQAAFEAFWA